ncbi:ASF1B isoform 5 [Pan troglodytes]|uniref:Anti-silencing function 1B histone chaperone n=4 Tax=Homininae TaxID=207598 RepID=K7ES22_HUMAN|nr:anti-silencing function 1B histone chaperone [Homo sapiens]KAI4040895.1 anti-silencing function 1B histone chaperone [Homo sapiens]PNI51008.1 ASF1B isoform 5 [Pan troglodytes]
MAKVSVLNVAVLENPSPFHSPFRFEISFECSEALADDLEWKIIYVGSAESEEFDQILDSVLVGPVPAGRHMFVFQLQRNILASNPRVTRFHINWDNNMDRLEAIETQDPSLGCGLPLNCTPIKGLGLPGCIPGLLPENSMDCI